ncbi:MAG: PA2779 family protein [Deltaproteobacteria bacterium]|nr:PA2779 family protein [Deltaproteobacteria bacterium]
MQHVYHWRGARNLALFLAVLVCAVSVAPRARAGLIGNDALVFPQDQDAPTVQRMLENKKIQTRLEALGYSHEEVAERLKSLSDEEVHYLASRLERVTAAGDGLGVIVTLLVIILLVVVILEITDHRIIITQ